MSHYRHRALFALGVLLVVVAILLPVVLRATAFTEQLATQLTSDLLALRPPPTALFTSDLVTATGALRAVQAAGLTIPTDLSFVAFDDAGWTAVVTPPLTVVAQPAYDMGATAARLLIERVRGHRDEPATHVLPTTFVDRDSIGPPPAQP